VVEGFGFCGRSFLVPLPLLGPLHVRLASMISCSELAKQPSLIEVGAFDKGSTILARCRQQVGRSVALIMHHFHGPLVA